MSGPAVAEVLAESVRASLALFERYLAGFDDTNHTRQAPGLPNHAAWCLGHCAMTMHRAAERLGAEAALPAGDFLLDAARGDSRRFGTESVCFGSRPVDDPAAFPTLARCREIFRNAGERLAETAKAAEPPTLTKPTTFFGGAELPAWHAVPRAVFHNGMHCGQIADLRRALGLGSVFE
jgi:hypothetical protein